MTNDKLYIVERIASIGFIDQLSYHRSSHTALSEMAKKLKEEIAKYRRSNNLAKGEDVPRGYKNGEIRLPVLKTEFNRDVLREATIFSWHKVSHEYDEWDVQGETYRVREVALAA